MGTVDRTETDAHRFAPAAPDEKHVFGACSPGWHSAACHEVAVDDWLSFMDRRGIERVCAVFAACGSREDGSLASYREHFGASNVVHVPVFDGRLVDAPTLRDDVLPFLAESEASDSPVVVHCLSGVGRTGQVLAAWVVYRYGEDPRTAIETVREMGRDPRAVVEDGRPSLSDLHATLAESARDSR